MVHLQFIQLVLSSQVLDAADSVLVKVELLKLSQRLKPLHLFDLVVLQSQDLQTSAILQSHQSADLVVVKVKTDDVLHLFQVLNSDNTSIVHIEVLQ